MAMASWFERYFPAWVRVVLTFREAGMPNEQIEHTLCSICDHLGAHRMFVSAAMCYLRQATGDRVYVSPARFN